MERAERDSVRLFGAALDADASMALEFGKEEGRVKIDDRFKLKKESGAPFRTEPVSHSVDGDTALLLDMYTFRDPRGNPRTPQGAELAGLSFGADFLALLRSLLGEEGRGYTLRDSLADIGGRRCYLFSFATDEKRGRFWIGRDSCEIARMEIEQDNDLLVGSYKFKLTTDFLPFTGDLLLPVKTLSQFEYSRFGTGGTGSIVVVLDSVRTR
jgi:hypothetical protein